MRTTRLLAAVVFAAALAACSQRARTKTTEASPPPPPPEPTVAIERPSSPAREGSTIVLGKIRGRALAFVADADTGAVRTIDLDQKREIASVALGSRPGQLLLTRSGRVAVALRDSASVALLAAHADGSLALDHHATETELEPVGLALSPDDATLFVVTGWSHSLEAFHVEADGALGARTFAVSVDREPRGVAVSADGARAFVVHAASSKLEEIDFGGKVAATTDLGIAGAGPVAMPMIRPMPPRLRREPVRLDFAMPCDDCGADDEGDGLPPRFARQGYALAHVAIPFDGATVETFIVPHTEVMTGDPMVISSGYGGGGLVDSNEPAERFVLSMIDAKTAARKMLIIAGDARDKTGCHLPRGAATDGTGHVYVACFGSDSVMSFTAAQKTYDDVLPPDPNAKLVYENGAMVAPQRTRKVPYLSVTASGRVPVPGGPSGVAFDADHARVVSFSQIDGALSIIGAGAFGETHPTAETIKLLRSSGLGELAARGRKIFFSGGDARIAQDGRACSSCHPEGRDDGLVWSTPDGPRQTILLAGRENRTGPFGWLGKHATLQVHMEATMKNLKGAGLPLEDRDALAAFVTQLKRPTDTWRTLTAEESHGRALFESGDAQCSSCHAGSSGFTDHDTHDVKSATSSDKERAFLVPSLEGIGASAPYFHDGRYASLEELLDKSDTMGSTKRMSATDKKALAAYLRTL